MPTSPISQASIDYINEFFLKTGKRYLAVDLASRVVQICYYSIAHKKIINKEIRASELESVLSSYESGTLIVGFEACGACHYWARRAQEMGHEYRCFMAENIRNRKKKEKTDKIDALAIFKALLDRDSADLSIKCKSLDHQMLSSLMTTRSCITSQKVKSLNALRAFMYELGVVLPRDLSPQRMIKRALAYKEQMLLEQGADSEAFIFFDISLQTYIAQIEHCVKIIDGLDKQIEELSRKNTTCQLLRTIPGVGYIIAMMLYIAGFDISNFKNAKHFAGYCGIAPHVEGSGGTATNLGVRHFGNRALAGMLYIGAMAHYSNTLKKTLENSENEQIKVQMQKRRKVLICAIANHIARTAFAVIRDKTPYTTQRASGLLTAYKECI